MKSQSGSALIFSSLLALSATALAACQPEVGLGADPETAVKGNATPAASPVKADPEGTVVDLKEDITDLAAVDSSLAVRTKDQLLIGSQIEFAGHKATALDISAECGDLSSSSSGFVLACPEKVLLIDPSSPDSPEEVRMEEETPVTAATQLSSGEIFATSADSSTVGIYKDGKREGDIEVEAGSDQLLAVPNSTGDDGVVRIHREDSTIQNVDWTNDRAGGRLRVGQGVGSIAVGDNGVILASDTEGGRLAVYTSDDVIRLHQYGNVDGTPWGVAWDKEHNLAWVSATDTNKAHAYEINKGVPELRGDISTVPDAQNIAVLADGTFVAASATGHGLQFVDTPHLKKES